jgi:hypothetical protein
MASRSTDAKDAASRLDVPLLLVLPPQHLVADQAVDLGMFHCVYALALGPGVLENLLPSPRVAAQRREFLIGRGLALALADGEVEEVQHGAAVGYDAAGVLLILAIAGIARAEGEADCGLQQHAHGLPEMPQGSSRRLPQREHLPGVGF